MVELIQEHIPPPHQITPRSPSELERAQHLAKLLQDKLNLDNSIQAEVERVSKARLAVAEVEDDLSILQQEVKGLANQIDARHREDDARRERSQGFRDQNDAMDGVFVEEVDSGEEVGIQAEGGKKRKVGTGRFGGGMGSARIISPAQLLEVLRGMSEEDQNARWSTSSDSRPGRGPEFRGGNDVVEEGFSVQGQAGCWRKACSFLSSCHERCMSRRGPVVTRAST